MRAIRIKVKRFTEDPGEFMRVANELAAFHPTAMINVGAIPVRRQPWGPETSTEQTTTTRNQEAEHGEEA